MLKPIVLSFITALLFSVSGWASNLDAKPELIEPQKMEKSDFLPIINVSDEELFNFTQNPLPDFFRVLESHENTIGASQGYQNSVCFATVAYFNPSLGRLSNTKIKRYLKEATRFQITHQDSFHEQIARFHYTAGAQTDQIDVLMAAAVKDNILQVRTTCQILPQKTIKENRKTTVFWTKDIAQKMLEKIKSGH